MLHENRASTSSLGDLKYDSAIYMSAAKFVLIFLYIRAVYYHHCVNTMSHQLLRWWAAYEMTHL